MGSLNSLSIEAAKPQEGIAQKKIPSCAYGTPIAELSGLPYWKGTAIALILRAIAMGVSWSPSAADGGHL